jgi:hypothetical protein
MIAAGRENYIINFLNKVIEADIMLTYLKPKFGLIMKKAVTSMLRRERKVSGIEPVKNSIQRSQ